MALVYRHIRKDTNEPFYIGASTKKNRPYMKEGRNLSWQSVVRITDYDVHILFDGITLDEAKEKEREFIALYKRIKDGGTLCNRNSGGDGFREIRHTEAYRKNMSYKNRGEKNPMFGKSRPDELKKQLSLLWQGEKSKQAKLTDKDIRKIRKLYKDGYTYIKLTKEFNVSLTCIGDIIRGKTWKHT